MAMILDGKALADSMARWLASEVKSEDADRAPKLRVFRGMAKEDPFTSGLVKRAGEIGIDIDVVGINHLPIVNDHLVSLSNRDDGIDGIIVSGKRWNIGMIRPQKDVDHYHDDSDFRPAVAMAVTRLLDGYDYDVYGCEAVVVGRSRRVGLPIALDLLSQGATVTVCHTGTKDIGEVVKRADLVISCAGVKDLIRPSFVKKGAWVIDVGGDVQWSDDTQAEAITPRTGGIGPLTVVCALKNVVIAWTRRLWRMND